MRINIADEKVLVTGGTGFLGRYVVERLISEGVTPTVMTRNLPKQSNGKTNFVKVDLLNFPSVKKFIEDFRPDRIIHLAGYVHQATEQSDAMENLNYRAAVHLLDLANSVNVKKIILTGTADEYGFQSAPQVESMAAKPVSDYAVSKHKAVNYALSLHDKNDLQVIVARPFTIYGIGQPARMFVAQAIENAVKGIPFEMSKGEQKRDLLFVSDFVNAIIRLLTADNTAGEIYNVGSGETIKLKNLALKIWEIAEADLNLLKIGARPTNVNELHDTQADITKIKRLDWKPKISLDEGLKLIIEKAKKDWQ